MTRWLTFALALVAPALLAGPGLAQTTLRYKFKQGDKLDYAMDQDMKMSMNVGGMDIDMKMVQQMDMTWDVQKVDDQGNARIQLKMGRVKMAMKGGPMGDVEIDSKDEKQPEDVLGKVFAQIVTAMADMQMTFTMTPAGEMKDVEMSEKALKAFKNLPGADKLGGDLFSPEGMKRMVQGNMSLPKDPVKKGDTWAQKTDVKMPFGKTTGDIKYTYEGPADKDGKAVEKIAMVPEMKIEPDPNAPFKLTMKNQQGKGTIYFDNQAGRMHAMANETTMDMAIEVANMTINQRIVQNTSLRLKSPSSGSSEK
jgi:hypothetical protein